MVNTCVFVGRMTKDVELRTAGGKPVCDVYLAVDRRFKKGEADFIKVTCWNKDAEYICNYGGKGRLLCVEGWLRVDKFTNKHAEEQTTYSIIAQQVSLLDRGKTATTETVDSDSYDPFL